MRFQDLTRLLSGLIPIVHHVSSRTAFEQGDWMAELELLQLAQDIQRLATAGGGFEGELFDLMVSIAGVLERDHGWEREQSNDWLIRMGLWEEDLPTGA